VGEARGRGAARPEEPYSTTSALLPVPDRCGASESLQWFVKTKPLAAPAIRAVREGETRIVPAQWEKTYYEWMENIHDWCISGRSGGASHSGVPLPRVREDDGRARTAFAVRGVRGDRHPAGRGRSRHLVLLRPLAVLDPRVARKDGGSRTVLPTSVLVTGFDILFFWVARMMMMGIEFTGKLPSATW